MLLQSSGLLWAVVQVLISGSQSIPRYEAQRSLGTEWTPIENKTCILESSIIGKLHLQGISYCKLNCNEPDCKSIDYTTKDGGICRLSSTNTSGPCDIKDERQFTSKIEPVCQSPFNLVDDQCFYAIPRYPHHTYLSWEDAREYCVNQLPGTVTDLASPNNLTALNEYLITLDIGKVWIGGYNFAKNINSKTDREWLWMNRKPITHQFAKEHPPFKPGNCVYMSNFDGSPTLVGVECDAAGADGFGLVCEQYI